MPLSERRLLWGLTGPAALIIGWQSLISSGALDLEFVPAPGDVAAAFLELLFSGELPAAVAHTVLVALSAAAIAVTVGGVTGLALGLLPALSRWVMASADVLRSIPAIALIPVVVVTLGPAPASEIMLACYAALWPVVLNTAGGVAAVHQRHRDVGRTLQLRRLETLGRIVLPATVPAWLVGARIAAVIALLVAVVTEMIVYPKGLGGGIIESMHALAPERMWAYALACGMVGVIVNAALRFAAARTVYGSTTGVGRTDLASQRSVQPSAAPTGLVPLIVVLVIWQLTASPASIGFPPPSQWWAAVARLHSADLLVPAIAQTLSTYLLGLGVAVVIGAAVGMAVGRFRLVDACLTPTIDFLAAIPGAAIVPAVIVLLGPSALSAVAVVAFVVSWPVLLSTATVMRAIPAVRLEMSRSIGLSPLKRWRSVVLPSVRPGVALSARVAASLALIITLVVDMIGTGTGIGRLLILSQQHFDAAAAWGLLALVGTFGYLASLFITRVESRTRRSTGARAGGVSSGNTHGGAGG